MANQIFEKFLNEFLVYLKSIRGYSVNTIQSYRNDLERLINFLESKGVNDFNDVDKIILSSFFSTLDVMGLSTKSLARNYSSVKVFSSIFLRTNI